MIIKKAVAVAINISGQGSNEGYLKTVLNEVNTRVPYKAFAQENNKDVSIGKSSNLKGMIKLGLGFLYFISLVFFLAQLLS